MSGRRVKLLGLGALALSGIVLLLAVARPVVAGRLLLRRVTVAIGLDAEQRDALAPVFRRHVAELLELRRRRSRGTLERSDAALELSELEGTLEDEVLPVLRPDQVEPFRDFHTLYWDEIWRRAENAEG